ncbi:hypothetical protein V5N11_032973 [Cardamine amara subsp. amara]|uniref:Transmembrane protein n=1 Tax=Cardamine amara subsp. amara TaxID=228776 RepID=A0ABD1ALG9_CARAN
MKKSGFVFLLVVIVLCLFSLASSEMKLGLEDYSFQTNPHPVGPDREAKSGPIEHGTPLNPYVVPKPQSQDGG